MKLIALLPDFLDVLISLHINYASNHDAPVEFILDSPVSEASVSIQLPWFLKRLDRPIETSLERARFKAQLLQTTAWGIDTKKENHSAIGAIISQCQNISPPLPAKLPLVNLSWALKLTFSLHSFVGIPLKHISSKLAKADHAWRHKRPISLLPLNLQIKNWRDTLIFTGDYCDVYLTHDSMSVRKAHNSGRNHLRNVVEYYQRAQYPSPFSRLLPWDRWVLKPWTFCRNRPWESTIRNRLDHKFLRRWGTRKSLVTTSWCSRSVPSATIRPTRYVSSKNSCWSYILIVNPCRTAWSNATTIRYSTARRPRRATS